jgi:carbon storage regulator
MERTKQGGLVLTRKLNEKIVIDGDIVVTVTESKLGRVRLHISAPKSVRILRGELIGEAA